MDILNVMTIMFCIALFLLCLMIAFIIGYTLGCDKTLNPKRSKSLPQISKEHDEQFKKAKKEYENFLNYDGSAQK